MRGSAAILALAAFVENLRVSVFAVSSPFGDGARGFSIARGVAVGSAIAGDLPLVVAGVEWTAAEFFEGGFPGELAAFEVVGADVCVSGATGVFIADGVTAGRVSADAGTRVVAEGAGAAGTATVGFAPGVGALVAGAFVAGALAAGVFDAGTWDVFTRDGVTLGVVTLGADVLGAVTLGADALGADTTAGLRGGGRGGGRRGTGTSFGARRAFSSNVGRSASSASRPSRASTSRARRM